MNKEFCNIKPVFRYLEQTLAIIAIGGLGLLLSTPTPDNFLPSDLSGAAKYGCYIRQVEMVEQSKGTTIRHYTEYRTVVFVEYQPPKPRYEVLYSIRPKIKQAYKDCDEWRNKMRKLIVVQNGTSHK